MLRLAKRSVEDCRALTGPRRRPADIRPTAFDSQRRWADHARPEDVTIENRELSWIEIDLDALERNVALFRRMIGPAELVPVIKADAYGHGAAIVTGALLKLGVGWLAVNGLDEALAARREAPTARILVLGYVHPDRFPEAVAAGLDLTLTNPDEIGPLNRAAGEAGARARLHIKLETGTHRRGLTESDHDALAAALDGARAIDRVGVCTHFANIEDTINHAYAQSQLGRFGSAVDALEDLGVRFERRHLACTAAALLFPETHAEMVRVGIGLYGLWPSRETRLSYRLLERDPVELEPCLTWKARVVQVKSVPAGSYVGYGGTYRTTAESRIGVLPLGYHEGYDRGLSNTGHVLVRGHRAAVRGRVCMNMTLVDLTHVPGAAVGDEAVLIGRQGDDAVSADDLAGWAGTINYEIVSRIHPSLPRAGVRGR